MTAPRLVRRCKNWIPKPAPRLAKMPTIPNDYKWKKIVGTFDDKYIKYESGSKEKLTINEYLENIGLYVHDLIDNLKTSGEWKIHLTMKMKLVLATGSVEYCQIHS